MCGRLVNLDTVARVLADYYHLKTDTQLAALDEALSRVPAVSVVGGYRKDHVVDPNKMVGDLISRAAVVDTIEGVDWYHINRNGEMVHGANDDEHQAWYKADDIYKAIERVPSAQPGWIQCSERLPEEGEVVLTQAKFKDDMKMAVSSRIDYNYWTGWGTRDINIIAWMPLPKPWEGR